MSNQQNDRFYETLKEAKEEKKKQKKDWCDRSEKPTFQDKFGEILHGGYGYAR